MTKQQTIDTLKAQLPAFYSLEQVISLIEGIEDGSSENEDRSSANPKLQYTQEQRDDLVVAILDEIEGLDMDIISDYDLSMNYKEVELDSIDFNRTAMANVVEDAIDNWINENFNN
jgi:hypothetical protein